MPVGGWCIWTPGGSGDDDDQVPGVIDITSRGSGESIERPGGVATYNCSRGGSGFLETWRGESLGGDKHDTPCIVYQLGAIICWRHNLLDSANLSTHYPMFSIATAKICWLVKLRIKCFHIICQKTIICWQLDVFHIPEFLDKKGVKSDIISELS